MCSPQTSLALTAALASGSVHAPAPEPAPTQAPIVLDARAPHLDMVAAELLEAHNRVRAGVGVAPLRYEVALAESAQVWADELAANSCAFDHDPDTSEGENLWWSNYVPRPTEVVDTWAAEVEHYDLRRNTCAPGEMCGHYTQIVWEDTTAVGCAARMCDDGAVLWVCRYDPAGNWVGQRPY